MKPAPTILTILALSACVLAPRAQGAPPQQIHAVRIEAPIKVDGDLSDPGWRDASRVDLPYEINRTDNGTPPVKTTGLVAYDSKYLYVALICEDPDPKKIRAPFTDRDGLGSDQDFAGIFLDTRHDGRSALELFVNPRGIPSDGVTNDATGQEDFSPDLFWDSAARITDRGWDLEMRLPLTSLRYPKADPQTWGIIFYRNYPRDFRYQITQRSHPQGGPMPGLPRDGPRGPHRPALLQPPRGGALRDGQGGGPGRDRPGHSFRQQARGGRTGAWT